MSEGFLQTLTPRELLAIVCQYGSEVAGGNTISGNASVCDSTILGYISSAVAWIKVTTQSVVPLYTNNDGAQTDKKLHPYLAAILSERRKWAQKREQRQPLTGLMIEHMAHMVTLSSVNSHSGVGLDMRSALYDWICLGIFCGLRLGEFGQSALPAGNHAGAFDPLPTGNSNIPLAWQGTPKSFVLDDFQFFAGNLVLISHSDLYQNMAAVEFVHVRWRYDKGKFNFITKKYQRQHGTLVCPVKRAANIVLRALALRLHPRMSPVGVFLSKNSQVYTIRGHHVRDFIQESCIRAYPDPAHYLRLHIKELQAHSLRITACVALDNAGVPHETIAFRLRWNSDAVKGYLRDCYRHIGDLTAKSVAGLISLADISPVSVPCHVTTQELFDR
jgi:hypothetical protein